MKAMLLSEFGAPFAAGEIATPEAGAGQIRIKVEASSVNPIDTKIRVGAVPAVSPDFPAVLHGDVAGVVDQVGDGVAGIAVGDRVYGVAGGFKGHAGALAEYMVVNPAHVAHMPSNLDFAEAAALPLVACTAWMSLFDKGDLQAGQRVLIQGGTGGVGHVAVQLAAIAGAEVTASVSSEEKAVWAKKLGAHNTVEYANWTPAEHAIFDLVFDTPGGASLDASMAACARYGTVVGIAGRSEHNLGLLHTKELTLRFAFLISYFVDPNRRAQDLGDILRKVARYVETGQLQPVVGESFPMSQVNEAHARLEAGGVLGKVVLTQDL